MDKLTQGWVRYQRNASRNEAAGHNWSCPYCQDDFAPDVEAFKAHVRSDVLKHQNLDSDDASLEAAFRNITINNNTKGSALHGEKHQSPILSQSPLRATDHVKSPRKRPVPESGDVGEHANEGSHDAAPKHTDGNVRESKKRSPPTSIIQQRGSSPSTPGRSRARPNKSINDFERGYGQQARPAGQLWNPESGINKKQVHHSPRGHHEQPRQPQQQQQQQHAKSTRPASNHRTYRNPNDIPPPANPPPPLASEDPSTEMIRQPETRPISQEQLVTEVKGIYAGLVMVESKCIEVDNANTEADRELSSDQWQALIALHRTLLHEHHDFFLASQHPSASGALRRLAAKYAMPARMWRHGIHSFLELLRRKLPDSLEHMLTFIYLAYSMMALLYETVNTFADTWIECLGDLGRYRMAIEDDDIRDREIWTGVSRHWYTMASERQVYVGRLYHHLAILARPNAVQQLYYYTKSLCVLNPFISARESIMTLFDPLLNSKTTRLMPIDAAFVRVHGVLFSGKCQEQLQPSMAEFLDDLDGHIGRSTRRWLEASYHIGIVQACSLLNYNGDKNLLSKDSKASGEDADVAMDGKGNSEGTVDKRFEQALYFAIKTYEIVIRRWGDMNTLPYLHTSLVFILHMSRFPLAMAQLETRYPWKLTSIMLNYLMQSCTFEPKMDSKEFPVHDKDTPRPLPEDHAMRGLLYVQHYFPNTWFGNTQIDEDEKYFELGSMVDERKERILWLGRRIAEVNKWLTWDDKKRTFDVDKKYDVDLADDFTAEAKGLVGFPAETSSVSEAEDVVLTDDSTMEAGDSEKPASEVPG